MSIFNFEQIAETVYRGDIPNPDWILPDAGEYVAQCVKIEGREVEGRRVTGTFLFCELSWEIMDDEVRRKTNIEHPTARQSFSLAMNGQNQLDLGPNQNMSLKSVWKATGILRDPNIQKILHQTAWVRVEHEPMNDREGEQMVDPQGRPMFQARVTRVTSLDQGRARQAQQQALAAQ